MYINSYIIIWNHWSIFEYFFWNSTKTDLWMDGGREGGMEWNGVEWNGMERNGMEWKDGWTDGRTDGWMDQT